MNQMQGKREKWVDDVKVFACILVALGHFFQSMVNAGILPETGIFNWFDTTIYYFHVPLFFLCSGYLYQKKAGAEVCYSWRENVARKGVALGIPYVVFSTVTWLLKEVFSGSVNSRNAGLVETLFLSPASPYWYLYTLFFIFAVTPRFRSSKMATVGVAFAALLKGLRIFGLAEADIYALSSLMDNALWFVLGMQLRFCKARETRRAKNRLAFGIGASLGFLVVSVLTFRSSLQWKLLPVVMGIWGCAAVVLTFRNWNIGNRLRRLADMLAKYTMPVFLMHTIFAAGLRAVLLKLGISAPAIHVAFGIMISFAGPIIATMIMERLKLDILLYPGKYLFKRKSKELENV